VFPLPECEGYHVVVRGCYHSCEFSQNNYTIITHDISRVVAGDAWLQEWVFDSSIYNMWGKVVMQQVAEYALLAQVQAISSKTYSSIGDT